MPKTLKLADESLNDKLSTDQLLQEGYDGVKYDNGDGEFYYEIFNPEKLRTTSQLTEIYNKAHNK